MKRHRYRSRKPGAEGEAGAVALAVCRLGWITAGMSAMTLAQIVFG